MNLKEFVYRVNEVAKIAEMQHKNLEDIDVGILVKVIGSIGPLPTVSVKNIGLGIDWDKGKCLITPEKELRETDMDEIKAIQKKFDDMGWAYYEATKTLKKK